MKKGMLSTLLITIFSCMLLFSVDISAQFGEAQIIDNGSCENLYPCGIVHLTSSDIDRDGDQDVLSVAGRDKITLYKNDGKGNFSSPIFLTESEFNFPVHISTVDFDKDGDQDILVAVQAHENKIFWLRNDGAGNFGDEIIIDSGRQSALYTLNVIDFDKDGDMDIVSYNDIIRIVLYANDGKGNFQRQLLVDTPHNGPFSYVVADFDGDNDNDILYANKFVDEILIYKNDGQGRFLNNIKITQEHTNHVFSVDLDSDGDQDIASFSTDFDGIKWYKNDGLGSFRSPIIVEFDSYVDHYFPYNIVFEDLDKDGDIDMIGSAFSKGMSWYENDGIGNFLEYNIGSYYSVKQVVDLDNDGKLDLLGASGKRLAWHKSLLGTTSFNQVLPAQQLKIYPNPFNKFLTIEQTDYAFDTAILNIFDSTGLPIASHSLKGIAQQIFTFHLADGLYFYRVVHTNGQMIANGKVVKH